MKIHKEGYRIILVIFVLLVILLFGINQLFPEQTFIHYILYFTAIGFYFFVVRFFRVPNRQIIIDNNAIYAPADGTVVVIEEVEEPEYFKDRRRQISIFMSPLNVHINYYPISGSLVYKQYHPGRFLVAWHPKSSKLNERNTLVVEHTQNGKSILFRQIAGFMARRIVNKKSAPDIAIQGDEFGMIKFGSRVDIFIPLDAKVNVELDEKVTAKKTIIAYFE
ncbi:MAG: phosphatidylserine decarboxylase family protein [Bacteroidota bacterium]